MRLISAADAFNMARQSCFTGETKIYARGWWGEGWRRIDQLTILDEVLARDEFNPYGPLVWKKVEGTFARWALVHDLDVNAKKIGTTLPHRFFVNGKAWTPAGQMRIGDRILGMDLEQDARVEGVSRVGRWAKVYNIRVQDFATYFVGGEEWGFSVWAHNTYLSKGEIEDAAENYAAISRRNGGRFYGAWDQVAPGRVLKSGDKRAIRNFIRNNPSRFPDVEIRTRNSGGLAGDARTRVFDESVARQLKARGWELENGPLSGRPQQWIPGPVPGSRAGGTQIDLTASRVIGGNRRFLRVQTIDTLADGITPTAREAANAARIRARFPNDHLLLIPKPW